MKTLLWLNLVTRMATIVAHENGNAPRELAYLQLLTSLTDLAAVTDADLKALQDKYEAEVAGNIPTSADELRALASRIQARGERIQGA